MKKQKLRLMLSTVLVSALLMTSCGIKMDPLASSLFNAEPSPLELVGGKVPVTVNGRFPAKWFNKSVTVRVTPVLKHAEGEILGTSQVYQGEKVAGNGIVINQKEGGAMAVRTAFDYIPQLNKSELFLRFAITKNGNEVVTIPDVKVADGVIATEALATAKSTTPALAPDAFQRIIKETYDADIMFLIQRAEVRKTELNSSDLAAWKDVIKEANDNDRKNLNIEVSAYASPDGGYKLNNKLAEQRERNTSSYLKKELKNSQIESDVNAKYTAQDWDGFKKLVQASSLQDKNLVLSVLSMYSDPVEREKEIKNISAVYKDLAETVLPQLRRSRLIANVEVIGKSDAELVAAAAGNLSELTVEELLYAATLDGTSKETIYTFVTKNFANDYRGWNNLGAVQFEKGQLDKAKSSFNKAKQVSARAAEPNMNLALIELADGNVSSAEQLLGNASGANTLNEAMGLLYVKKGDYKKAVQAFGSANTNNAAIAQILSKNYSQAQRILDNVVKKDATTSYLAAIVASRTNNRSAVVSNLKTAISKGASRSQIANDIEFAKFASDIQSL